MGNKSISTSVAALVVVIITLTGCRVDQRTEQAFCRLEATVVSPSGETIEGADVIFRRASRGPNDVIAIETTTAKGGCAVDLPVNTAVVLSVMAEGRLLPTVPVLVTPPVSWSNVTVTLARAETDTGERWRFLWAEPLDYLNQCEEIQETTERVVQSWNQEIRRHVDPETGYAEIPEVSKEFVRGRDRLNTWMETAEDSRIRAFAAVHRLWLETQGGFINQISSDLADRVLKAAPLSSPFWGFYPNGISVVLGRKDPDLQDPECFRSALETCLATNPDRRVQAEALAAMVALASYEGDLARTDKLYQRIVADFSDVYDEDVLRAIFNPEGSIREGRPAPHFAVTLLDGRGLTYDDFKGEYLLIHFWGTWCGPCKAEMPWLHEAHEQFSDRGLQILSLAVNDSKEKVKAFRDGQWSMPWEHSVLHNGFESGPARQFDVHFLPYSVLVDPKGVVAASGRKTHGDQLLKTLEKRLGPVPEE